MWQASSRRAARRLRGTREEAVKQEPRRGPLFTGPASRVRSFSSPSPRELVAQVRAVLRRTQGAETPLVETLSFDGGALKIDTVQHEVRREGEIVDLTPNEYRLLVTLARYPGRVYSRFELIRYEAASRPHRISGCSRFVTNCPFSSVAQ